ncbi:MAG: NAD(P)-dependent oxidoreductase [Gammaproteobacteria bacterium]
MKILVTGLSGLIGGALHRAIGDDHELTAFNRSDVAGVRTVRADLGDMNALRQAATGQDVVVHLAAKAGEDYTWEELREPYRALVEGRYDQLPESWPLIEVDTPVRPRGVYGSTKIWGEALAHHFADTTPTTFLNVRIGYVNAEDRPNGSRQHSVWCSQRDVVNALRLASEAPEVPSCATFFANSSNRYGYRDLSRGKALLGYEPQDGAD